MNGEKWKHIKEQLHLLKAELSSHVNKTTKCKQSTEMRFRAKNEHQTPAERRRINI